MGLLFLKRGGYVFNVMTNQKKLLEGKTRFSELTYVFFIFR